LGTGEQQEQLAGLGQEKTPRQRFGLLMAYSATLHKERKMGKTTLFLREKFSRATMVGGTIVSIVCPTLVTVYERV
jgi:hypothetical protein